MQSKVLPIKELIVARFDKGKDLLQGIIDVVKAYQVSAGVFTVIGAVDQAHYGFYNPKNRQYTVQTWNPGPNRSPALEILSCLGNVAVLNEEPVVHAHITLRGELGETVGGHLLAGCRVNPTSELTLLKAQGTIHRKKNPTLNLALMDL